MSQSSLLDRSDAPYWSLPGFKGAFREGELTLGLTLPVEEDAEENPKDSLDNQVRLIQKAEAGGFAAVWVRDIPLRVETFGDVGQVYDPWMYLSYLSSVTSTIALGTAAIVVPLAHPLLLAKRAATLDRLSGGRFLMGVATGDRPEEFPAFGIDKGERDEIFRENIAVYRKATTTTYEPIKWSGGKMGGSDVVPTPQATEVPLLATGSCLQTMEWRAEHTHGWLMYHKGLEVQRQNVRNWRTVVSDWADRTGVIGTPAAFKPFAESLWLDIHPDPDAPASGGNFGYRLGRNALIELLRSQREVGINHVMVNFRTSTRPAEEQLDELISHVIPALD
ncbi:LLM class oxidoreductase [Corynebacterium aquatimens]|uniref:Luciferase-type oxidoreductase n=1 Tax=Corynebacterium aquatimens TaxID=1190508 RepID=A0A931E531_9CORY|nr:LLM class oxidoreductase [Corynebacterium aquatimens]MBG6123236.1 luciferase-type oxidoreductase [Corynebacterium aquatimens]WJY66435.1 Alkanal monooxygenase alpha chain [Corynebacterium aquatimens]